MVKKQIDFKEFDEAIKASYQLGLLDGRDQCKSEMDKLRIHTNLMLTTNKELYKMQQKADTLVIISFSFAEKIIASLATAKCVELRDQLRREVNKALGKPKTSDRRNDIKEE